MAFMLGFLVGLILGAGIGIVWWLVANVCGEFDEVEP